MIFYAILLLILGVVLTILEILLPTGGVLGFLAASAIIAALYLAFGISVNMGLAFLTATIIFVPVVIGIGLKYFPRTPIGRRLILNPSPETDAQRGKAGISEDDYSQLLGKTGKTVTQLRPSGIAEIEGERYSVATMGELIDRGCDIVVVKVEGNNIVVGKTIT